jgi:formylglycine-generating enzyme required for sulfatase activity
MPNCCPNPSSAVEGSAPLVSREQALVKWVPLPRVIVHSLYCAVIAAAFGGQACASHSSGAESSSAAGVAGTADVTGTAGVAGTAGANEGEGTAGGSGTGDPRAGASGQGQSEAGGAPGGTGPGHSATIAGAGGGEQSGGPNAAEGGTGPTAMECEQGDEQILPCDDPGLFQRRICSEGQWTTDDECFECRDDSTRYAACTTDEPNRFQKQTCQNGMWQNTEACESTPLDAMARIPSGEISWGSSHYSIKAFEIDVFEVTNQEYQLCVDADACSPAHYDDGKCAAVVGKFYSDGSLTINTGTAPEDLREAEKPVVCVDWFQAQQYCEWEEKALPDTLQWWRAALGTLDNGKSDYPWGDDPEPSCELAHIRDDGNNKESLGCGLSSTATVGSYPRDVSGFGVYDMTGNVEEWVINFEDGEGGLQGSGWQRPSAWIRLSDLSHAATDIVDAFSGFRCVKSEATPPDEPVSSDTE